LRSKGEKISYQERLRDEKDQRMRIFIRDVKDNARVVFEVKQIFKNQSFLSRLMPYSCDNPPRKIPYYRLRPTHFGH
jgi:hypothetical protein